MNEELLKQMQIELQEIKDLLRGRGQDGGLVHATLRLAEFIHGTKDNPGGLIKRIESQDERIERLTTIVKMGSGAAFVISIAWMVFSHFHK